MLGALCLGAGTAAAEPVEYKDPSETELKKQECTPVNATTKSLGAGWYSFSEDITITGTLALEGDVNLILEDDMTLTIKGGIAGEGYNLTVWGEDEDQAETGKLVVTGTNGVSGVVEEMLVDSSESYEPKIPFRFHRSGAGSAGITCKDLTINGGKVQSTGGAGGRGYDGAKGADGRNGLPVMDPSGHGGYQSGADGADGMDGGAGGAAIVCSQCVLRGGELTAQAGNGGASGAAGAAGGNGKLYMSAESIVANHDIVVARPDCLEVSGYPAN